MGDQPVEHKGRDCTGKRQSPIDLVTSSVVYAKHIGIYWGKGFFEEPLTQEISSNNHTVVLKATFDQTPYVAGGPLQSCYKLDSIHFHWSSFDHKGSEHTLNGISYPMEMHIVCTKGNLTMEEAVQVKDGITVLGYFIDILPDFWSKRKPKNPFSIMAKSLDRIRFVNENKSVGAKFAISNLVIPFNYNYLTYEGSLTTGDCNEVVTWIISPNVLKISRPQLNVFRGLHPRNLMEEPSNYRSTQPLNGRKVSFVKGSHSSFHKEHFH